MVPRLDTSSAAGFAPACLFECGEDWDRDAIARQRSARRWRGAMAIGATTVATLALAALLVVI
jgi:hypothetical protein